MPGAYGHDWIDDGAVAEGDEDEDDDDLDAHLADEFDEDGQPMDELGATLDEDEQRERFGGYGRSGEE